MLKRFRKAFREMVYERCDDIAVEQVHRDPEYIEHSAKAKKIFRQLADGFCEEVRTLIVAYEEELIGMLSVSEVYIYEQGLRDGIDFTNIRATEDVLNLTKAEKEIHYEQ